MRYSILVETRLRPGVADPQGATIERSLPALGFEGIADVRVGKAIRFELEAPDEAAALTQADEMTQRFLINPVIESADLSLVVVDGA